MARRTPDLASCLGSGDVSCKMEESGAFGSPDVQNVQNQGPASAARPVPRNFVWRLGGGRHIHAAGGSADRDAMAVDVPVLRECFDPWNHHQQADAGDGSDGQDGRCRGCSKILKAKARAAAAAKPPLPHVPTNSKCHGFVHVGARSSRSAPTPPPILLFHNRQAPANPQTSPRKSPESPQEIPWEPPRARGVPSRPDGTHPHQRQATATRHAKVEAKVASWGVSFDGNWQSSFHLSNAQNVGKSHPCQGGLRAGSRLLARGPGVRHGALHRCPKNVVSSSDPSTRATRSATT